MRSRADDLGKFCATAIATSLVAGFIMCAVACPTPQLIAAVGFECAFLIALIYWRHCRSASRSTPPGDTTQFRANRWLRDQYPHLARLCHAVRLAGTVITLVLAVAAAFELSAMALAFAGMTEAAERLYIAVPVSRIATGHPAQTIEYLAGAYADAGKYSAAHPLYRSLARIRAASLPRSDELVGAIWTDVGMLYMREKKYVQAEEAFRHSLALSTNAAYDLRAGRLLTGLANALREQHRYLEAEQIYLHAITMRSQRFGAQSFKVAESLNDYANLLARTGRYSEALECREKIKQIHLNQKRESALSPALIALATAATALLSLLLFGRDTLLLWLTAHLLERQSKRRELTTSERALATQIAEVKQPKWFWQKQRA